MSDVIELVVVVVAVGLLIQMLRGEIELRRMRERDRELTRREFTQRCDSDFVRAMDERERLGVDLVVRPEQAEFLRREMLRRPEDFKIEASGYATRDADGVVRDIEVTGVSLVDRGRKR